MEGPIQMCVYKGGRDRHSMTAWLSNKNHLDISENNFKHIFHIISNVTMLTSQSYFNPCLLTSEGNKGSLMQKLNFKCLYKCSDLLVPRQHRMLNISSTVCKPSRTTKARCGTYIGQPFISKHLLMSCDIFISMEPFDTTADAR